MAHTRFAKTLSEVTSGDGSLCRTLLESSQNSSSFSISRIAFGNSKTPPRLGVQTPVTPHSCGRNLSRTKQKSATKTPGRNNSKIYSNSDCDRFVPNRQGTDINRGMHLLRHNSDENSKLNSTDLEYQRAVNASLNPGHHGDHRILRYRAGGVEFPTKTNATELPPAQKAPSTRAISHTPEKVLDAPDIVDDFYLNLIDWSADNILAIALNQDVYLWNAMSGLITCLLQTELEGEYVTSVRWSPDVTNVLAVGLSSGRVQLWNASDQSLVRTMRLKGVSANLRVPALVWREHVVTSGSRSGQICHHDTRIPHHEIGIGELHAQEVCGLAWSPDKRLLASGANDNCVAIWSANGISNRNNVKPELTLQEHEAAVKALAWCPWKPNLLCSGGGTADHTLRFWNASSGVCVKSVDVVSQVSGIIWNTDYREIITSHGNPGNQLSIWKYPSIAKVADLSAHEARILSIVSCPKGEMIASCAGDETLRIWHCFKVDEVMKRAQLKARETTSVFSRGLR